MKTNTNDTLTSLGRALVDAHEAHLRTKAEAEKTLADLAAIGVTPEGVYRKELYDSSWALHKLIGDSRKPVLLAEAAFMRLLRVLLDEFNARHSSPEAVDMAMRAYGFNKLKDLFVKDLISPPGRKDEPEAATGKTSDTNGEIEVKGEEDIIYVNPLTSHHVIIRIRAKGGVDIRYFGSAPVKRSDKNGDRSLCFPRANDVSAIIRNGRVKHEFIHSEHVDEAIARFRHTLAFLEFWNYLNFRIPTVREDLPHTYGIPGHETALLLARQAITGRHLEIHLKTGMNRYNRKTSVTALKIDRLHLSENPYTETGMDLHSIHLGTIRVDRTLHEHTSPNPEASLP
jgi:hypothetical protein